MRERPQCTLVAALPEVRRKQSTVDEAPAWYTIPFAFYFSGMLPFSGITDYGLQDSALRCRIRNAATFRNADRGTSDSM